MKDLICLFLSIASEVYDNHTHARTHTHYGFVLTFEKHAIILMNLQLYRKERNKEYKILNNLIKLFNGMFAYKW